MPDDELQRVIRRAIPLLLERLTDEEERAKAKEEAREEHARFVEMGMRHTTTPEAIKCPRCGSDNTYKHGFRAGAQMYLCSKCGKRFNTKNAPMFMHSPSTRIASALSMFYRGLSLSDISEEHKAFYQDEVNPSTVYRWIIRYSQKAVDTVGKLPMQKYAEIWAIDETAIDVGGRKLWFWDTIDTSSRFLLGSHLSYGRTLKDADLFIQDAYSRATAPPLIVLSDGLPAYRSAVEEAFGADSLHIRGTPFNKTANTNRIERFHNTIKERTKVLRGFKTFETGNLLMQGFLVHYNHFREHMSLKGMTPATCAGIESKYHSWLDVVND